MHGKKKRILNLIFLILSIAFFSGYSFFQNVISASLAENRNSKLQLQKRKRELGKELQKAAEEVKKEAQNKDALSKEIKIVQNQIDVSNGYINALDKEIKELELQIKEIKNKMEEKVVTLRECLYCLYRANDTYTLDILLKSKDFEDFLDKAEMVRSVSNTIKKLIDELKLDLNKVNQKEQDLIKDKEEQETENKNLEESREKLQDLLDKSESLLSDLEKSEQKVKQELDENDAEIKAIDSQIQKYYEEQRRKEEEARKQAESGKPQTQPGKPGVVHKGGYVWPVPGFTRISSGFNDNENRAHKHGAIDIAGRGIYGAKVVSSGAGKVIMANTDGKGGGYGNYVVVDHGNGFSTLYGHLSNVLVKVGQTVDKGEQIGNVGNTGRSTGPHLHFECREKGIRVDPSIIVVY